MNWEGGVSVNCGHLHFADDVVLVANCASEVNEMVQEQELNTRYKEVDQKIKCGISAYLRPIGMGST